jgi:hypothetical protein
LPKVKSIKPPPWSVEEMAARLHFTDRDGQKLAYIYFEDEPGRRSAAKPLTHDEGQRIAANIAKLPELLGRQPFDFGGLAKWAIAIGADCDIALHYVMRTSDLNHFPASGCS